MSTRDSEPSPGGEPVALGAGPAAAGRNRRKPHDPVLLERLTEVGFLAVEFGLVDQAERIFRRLTQLKPDKPSPYIGIATVHARRGHMDKAIDIMRQVVEAYPDYDPPRVILGTMLQHAGQPGARELFEEVAQRGRNAVAVSVATDYVEQARTKQTQEADKAQAALEFHRHHNVRG